MTHLFRRSVTVTTLTIAFWSVCTANAWAGFVGHAIHVDESAPDTATVNLDYGTQVIAPAGTAFIHPVLYLVEISVSDTTIRYGCSSCVTPFSGSFGTHPFNGYVIADADGTLSDILGVTLNPHSNFPGFPDASRIAFDSDHIYLNFQGLNYNELNQAIFDVQFASAVVPEPGTLALMGVGIAGLAWRRKRRVPIVDSKESEIFTGAQF